MGASIGASGYVLTFAIAYIRDFALANHIVAESFETFVPWSRCRLICEGVKKDVLKAHRARCLPGNPIISYRVTQLYDEGACVYFYMAMYMKGVNEPSKVYSQLEKEARASILQRGGSLSHHHG
eukprot:1325801-Ditylum_brightwellii.AAC.1